MRACKNCGSMQDLNIEGGIRHGKMLCFDKRVCKRRQRKNKKQKGFNGRTNRIYREKFSIL